MADAMIEAGVEDEKIAKRSGLPGAPALIAGGASDGRILKLPPQVSLLWR
jgi:hypothetical protein